jgi:hypothetical protein
MHIPHSRRQKIHPRSNKLLHLLRTRQNPLHSLRIRHPVLPALDPARLSLRRNPSRVAISHQLLRLGEILCLFEVRHVDHDGIER